MRKLLVVTAALAVAVAVVPSSAGAWTHCGTPQAESDCPPITTCLNGVETQVPDNGQYTPGECPPPVREITVCLNGEQITVPEDQVPAGAMEGQCQPVVPPPNPPEAPVPGPTPPTPDTPGTDTVPPPVQVDTPPDEGEGHVDDTPGFVKGQEQSTPQPAAKEQVAADTSTLPYTGLQVLGPFVLGAAGLAGGLVLRRRTA